jgi:hypothetical protein
LAAFRHRRWLAGQHAHLCQSSVASIARGGTAHSAIAVAAAVASRTVHYARSAIASDKHRPKFQIPCLRVQQVGKLGDFGGMLVIAGTRAQHHQVRSSDRSNVKKPLVKKWPFRDYLSQNVRMCRRLDREPQNVRRNDQA